VQPFVSRTFVLGREQVLCSFDKPVADGNDFRCDYRIVFPTRERRTHAYGVDEVQALTLAMQRAHMDLLSAPERQNEKLLWLDMEDLGLPLASNAQPADFSQDG
jgi:hypothetical protein